MSANLFILIHPNKKGGPYQHFPKGSTDTARQDLLCQPVVRLLADQTFN